MAQETKAEIRRRMKALETAFLQTDAPAKEAEEIWAGVESSKEFINAETVLLYMAIQGEVPTEQFIGKWYKTKRIIIPKVEGDILRLYEYSPDHLSEGYKGIIEPDGKTVALTPDQIDFALIPGVAFTRNGARLGRGKGFYDRLLPQLKCPCAGIGFSFRWIDGIPTDAWDAPLSMTCF